MSWKKHTYSQSLTGKEVTLIRDLTRGILRQEGLSHIPVRIKSGVWSTAYVVSGNRDRLTREWKIDEEYIQLGGKMLTGSLYPKRIYYISIYDSDYRVRLIAKPKDVMMADIIGSTIIEEIAHAVSSNKAFRQRRADVKSHGAEFTSSFKELWRKYFIDLKYKLLDIYGYNGISGEEYI